MKIKWNEYTWYSKLLAAIFFIIILPIWTFYIGMQFESVKNLSIQNLIVLEKNQPKPTVATKEELPVYVFQDFSSSTDPQIYLEGTLAPVKIESEYEGLKNVDVSIRCWKQTMTCALGVVSLNYAHPESKLYQPAMTGEPTVGILSISQWDKDKILAKGDLGSFPFCEKDVCGFNVELSVDLKNKTVNVENPTACLAYKCGINSYLLVGSNDTLYTGPKLLSPLIPVPVIDIQPSA